MIKFYKIYCVKPSFPNSSPVETNLTFLCFNAYSTTASFSSTSTEHVE